MKTRSNGSTGGARPHDAHPGLPKPAFAAGSRTLAWFLPLLVLGAAACGEDRVQAQLPRLVTDLVPDPSGEADFLVDFGKVPLGQRQTQGFRFENLGSAELASHSLGAELPFRFLITRGRTPVGQRSDLRVSFEPTEETAEPLRHIVSFSTNERAGGRSYSVRLQGHGIVPQLSCAPSPLDFGQVPVGATAKGSIQCTNPLDLPLELRALPIAGEGAESFSATLPGQAGQISVEASGFFEIQLEFRAQSVGAREATLVLQDALLNPVAVLELEADVVPTGLNLSPAGCLDFSYVHLGETGIRSLTVENVGPDPVRLEAIERAGDFSVATALPLSIPAGSEETLEILYQPTVEGLQQVTLDLQTDRDLEIGGPFRSCARGFGGGPRLSCLPESRDLGAVAIGVPSVATFECVNAGVEGADRMDPLFVRGITSDSPAFIPSIRNRDGSRFFIPAGYRAGETFRVEVLFDPAAEGFEAANIRVETSSNHVELTVSGEGRAMPPCDFSIEPPDLRFGVVAPGDEVVQSFRIRNHLETACLIRDLRSSDGTDPAFSLEPLSFYELAGNSVLEVPVRFAPTTFKASLSGKVTFEISNPSRRKQEVGLQGAALNRCLLIEPSPIDFGSLPPSCRPLSRTFELVNDCNEPLRIREVTTSDPETFELQEPTPAGTFLLPHRRIPIELSFSPAELRSYRAFLDVEVEVERHPISPEQHYRIGLVGVGSTEARQVDEFVVEGKPKVDILWVIDNSGSMNTYQDRIANNFPAFLDYTKDKNIDYQIGVTTTALIWGSYGTYCPGGVEGEENGRLFPADGSHPRILTPATPDLETHWKHNTQVGTCFALNQESAMEAAYRALSPPLINNRKDPRYDTPFQDGNQGFLRPDASLSIILVSDAIDYSTATSQWYLEFFRGLKNWDPDRLRVHSITGPRGGGEFTGCRAGPGDRMLELTRATNGVWMDICTPTENQEAWSNGLQAMSEGAFSIAFTDRFTLRGRPTDRSGDGQVNGDDIELRVNGVLLPSSRQGTSALAWIYQPALNQIRFTPLFAPRVGAHITATYDVACH